MSETRALQGYAYWHPDTGCEWHSAMRQPPQLSSSERADGWRIVLDEKRLQKFVMYLESVTSRNGK